MREINVYSHELNEVKVVGFFWLKQYGWCFDWYENEEEKKIDCKTYGIFPSEFVEIDSDYEESIIEFLKNQIKSETEPDIPVSVFFEFL